MQSGEVLELCDDYAKVVDKVHTGAILVDGLGVGDVGNIVLRDRQHLAEDGIIIVVLTLERTACLQDRISYQEDLSMSESQRS